MTVNSPIVDLSSTEDLQERLYGLEDAIRSDLSVSEDNGFAIWKDLPVTQQRCMLASSGRTFETNDYVNTDTVHYKASRTDLIELKPGMKFRVTTQVHSAVAVWSAYGADLKCQRYGDKGTSTTALEIVDQTFESEQFLSANPAPKYVVFSQFVNDPNRDFIKVMSLTPIGTTKEMAVGTFNATAENTEKILKLERDAENFANKRQDVLYGKTYVAFGDSYTTLNYPDYVDDLGRRGEQSDGYSQTYAQYRTYPVLIAERHGMILHNDARSGRMFNWNGSNTNSFIYNLSSSSVMGHVRTADYITLMFGNNESILSAGVSSDTDPSTVWGSFNSAMSTILSVNPGVKIGFITTPGLLDVQDSAGRAALKDEYVKMSRRWGIPYLDWTDPLVPMASYGRIDGDEVDEYAKTQRRAAYYDSQSIYHPTIPGHRHFSTVIENFIKTL